MQWQNITLCFLLLGCSYYLLCSSFLPWISYSVPVITPFGWCRPWQPQGKFALLGPEWSCCWCFVLFLTKFWLNKHFPTRLALIFLCFLYQISLYQHPEGLKESVKHSVFELEGIPSAGLKEFKEWFWWSWASCLKGIWYIQCLLSVPLWYPFKCVGTGIDLWPFNPFLWKSSRVRCEWPGEHIGALLCVDNANVYPDGVLLKTLYYQDWSLWGWSLYSAK